MYLKARELMGMGTERGIAVVQEIGVSVQGRRPEDSPLADARVMDTYGMRSWLPGRLGDVLQAIDDLEQNGRLTRAEYIMRLMRLGPQPATAVMNATRWLGLTVPCLEEVRTANGAPLPAGSREVQTKRFELGRQLVTHYMTDEGLQVLEVHRAMKAQQTSAL